jgi:hypothetical protein
VQHLIILRFIYATVNPSPCAAAIPECWPWSDRRGQCWRVEWPEDGALRWQELFRERGEGPSGVGRQRDRLAFGVEGWALGAQPLSRLGAAPRLSRSQRTNSMAV